MQIIVNGQPRDLDGPRTVAQLLRELGLGDRSVAVAVNREVVPRARHQEHLLADGDRVEVIQAVAGG